MASVAVDFSGLRDAVRDAVREALGVDGIAEVRRLVMRPGDRLVVKLDHCPDDEEAGRLVRDLRAALGDDVPVLILDPGADLEVISPEPGGA